MVKRAAVSHSLEKEQDKNIINNEIEAKNTKLFQRGSFQKLFCISTTHATQLEEYCKTFVI